MILASVCLMASISMVGWNALEHGVTGDGKTDDTAALQALLDQAGRDGGGVVHLPSRVYRIEGNLVIPGGVTLQGTFRAPPTNRNDVMGGEPRRHGTTLHALAGRGSNEGTPFITLGGNTATLAGVIVEYPEWRQSDVPPVPYPPCVHAENYDNVAILDCLLLNPYEGIRLIRAGRHFVRNVYGYPSWRGLYVDQIYDIGRVENCHFWPFGVHYKQDDPYCEWVNLHGTAFEFARTDWQYVTHTFCFGYGIGYRFSESEHGSCNGSFVGIGADCCRRSVLVEQAQSPGLLITNGEFVGRWGSNDSVCVEIGPKVKDKVSLVNCGFWGPNDRIIWQRGPGSQLTVQAGNFARWDIGGRAAAAIQLDAGKAIVQGNTFGEGSVHVQVGEAVRSALIIGNQAEDGLLVENHAGSRTQLLANEESRIAWSQEALANYRLDVGSEGDGPYLRGWHAREDAGTHTLRWSGASSRVVLPALANQRYTLNMTLMVPERALGADAGVYLEDALLAPLTAQGVQTVTAELVAPDDDSLTLAVRVQGWEPAKVLPDNQDYRVLGVQLHEIVLRSGDGTRIFDANTGAWIK